MTEPEAAQDKLARALDAALDRALPRPELPHTFHKRLDAALCRAGEADLSELRARLESEHLTRLSEFDSGYISLRRRTLATLIGAAFAAGAAITALLPWLQKCFGANAPIVFAWGGTAAGLAIAFLSWRAGAGDAVRYQRR